MKELGDAVRSLFEHILEICLFHSSSSFPVKKAKFLVMGLLQGIILYFSEMIVDVNGYSRKIF
jgi:hypothetical protein